MVEPLLAGLSQLCTNQMIHIVPWQIFLIQISDIERQWVSSAYKRDPAQDFFPQDVGWASDETLWKILHNSSTGSLFTETSEL
jgi:hypothetical protein